MKILSTGPQDGGIRLVLAHGAGAPMDSPFMDTIAQELAALDIAVDRFEFPYMARRRVEDRKPPPNRMPVLLDTWRQAVAVVQADHPTAKIAIGGKSMGGRAATMLAAEADCPNEVSAVVTLGYPFHPPGKPDSLRVDHFPAITRPVLFVQGARDPFGNESDVVSYTLPSNAQVYWSPDGDHDLKPRKASGFTHAQTLKLAAHKVANFLTARL